MRQDKLSSAGSKVRFLCGIWLGFTTRTMSYTTCARSGRIMLLSSAASRSANRLVASWRCLSGGRTDCSLRLWVAFGRSGRIGFRRPAAAGSAMDHVADGGFGDTGSRHSAGTAADLQSLHPPVSAHAACASAAAGTEADRLVASTLVLSGDGSTPLRASSLSTNQLQPAAGWRLASWMSPYGRRGAAFGDAATRFTGGLISSAAQPAPVGISRRRRDGA